MGAVTPPQSTGAAGLIVRVSTGHQVVNAGRKHNPLARSAHGSYMREGAGSALPPGRELTFTAVPLSRPRNPSAKPCPRRWAFGCPLLSVLFNTPIASLSSGPVPLDRD